MPNKKEPGINLKMEEEEKKDVFAGGDICGVDVDRRENKNISERRTAKWV